MSSGQPQPVAFEIAAGGTRLVGEEEGEGPSIVTLHGLSATRRQVLHGSRLLARKGYRVIGYDARGHGGSDPAPAQQPYTYSRLAGDLGALIEARAGAGRVVLVGHSMGAHTIATYALDHLDRVAGVILAGPAVIGVEAGPGELDYWDELADGLERDGIDGFLTAIDRDLDPAWRETVLRFTRERMERHEHPTAVARALREVPRSLPFAGLADLTALDVPALVVASHDEADPGHPYAIAEAWAERLPRAELISEARGESPLAWQGGKLSRAIASFCARGEVAERLQG